YVSVDNGKTWTLNSGVQNFTTYSLAINGTNLFAGTDHGVYMTSDNGTTWTKRSAGLPDSLIGTVFSNGSNLFAGRFSFSSNNSGDGAYLSIDNGITWTAINTGLNNAQVTSFAAI